jgi:tripartite-type tricarboxylate transporter receptor subunit TctC
MVFYRDKVPYAIQEGRTMRRGILGLTALFLAAIATPPRAQGWPERAVTLVVPFAPGGAADGIARIVGEGMARSLGQPVVVENVGGVGGTLGTARVKNAAPDGYTIGLGHVGTHAAAMALYHRLPYDPRIDFAPIALIVSAPMVLSVRKDLPATDLRAFIDYARKQGDRITNGNAGVGSIAHVSCAYFSALADIKPTEIPYKGNGPMMNDMLAGRLDFSCDQLLGVTSRIKSGQIRALAIATRHRSAVVPEVPTSIEAGLPDWQADAWTGLFAPRNVPAPVLAKLREAVAAALDDARVRQRLEELGAEMPSGEMRDPERFAAFVREEVERCGKIIRDARIPYSD